MSLDRPTERDLIEQAIARGWDDTRTALHLAVSARRVVAVRRELDYLADADAFATLPPNRRAKCSRSHPLTPDNTYQRPNGNRECRICKTARNKQREAGRAAARRSAA